MNIYIGNLSYGVKEQELQKVMEDYGAVKSVKIIKDRETGRSKGFAFCEMENDDEAKKAIDQLNGAEYSGRPMVVKQALPRN
jgi:RNA recognition motif-containing protein